jgi:hypothetical protein
MSLMLSGCLVYSLYRLGSKAQQVKNDALFGDWIACDSSSKLYIKPVEANVSTPLYTYEVMMLTNILPLFEKKKELLFVDTLRFDANVFRVGRAQYLDLCGKGDVQILNNFLPVHSFTKIVLNADSLFYFELDDDKLYDLFEDKHIRLAHHITPDSIALITAPGQEIQSFLQKYSQDPEAFMEPVIYLRQ